MLCNWLCCDCAVTVLCPMLCDWLCCDCAVTVL